MDAKAQRRWRNMLVAAMVDKKMGPEEQAVLEKMRVKLGLSEENAQEIVTEVRSNKSGIQMGGDAEDRLEIFRDILSLIWADGEVSAPEKRMVDAVAKHLKLSEDEVEQISAEVNGGASAVAPQSTANPAAEPASPQLAASTPAEPAAHQSAPSAPIKGKPHEKTGIELIHIEAGTFIYGDMSVGMVDKQKKHKAFAIGKYPVTNEQWMRFETETGYQGREDFGERFNGPKQPVVGVSHADALAYCEWAGLRLPSQVEWERAARGTDGRRYAWGNEYPTQERSHYGMSLMSSTAPRTIDVGQRPKGGSQDGCQDMIGNVDEWCQADAQDAPEAATRGANWLCAPYALNAYYVRMRKVESRLNTTGFRVACDG